MRSNVLHERFYKWAQQTKGSCPNFFCANIRFYDTITSQTVINNYSFRSALRIIFI